MRFGEDIDFSIRIFKAGLKCRLFPEAWVWHKRRTDFRKFFRQVYNSGIARINLYKKYPESLKIVHLLPAAFTVGVLLLLLTMIVGGLLAVFAPEDACQEVGVGLLWASTTPLILYSAAIFIDATCQYRSIKIGAMSIWAAFIQLTGYGSGFIDAWIKRCLFKRNEFSAFEKTFYK